jgi:hypothetical protein
MKNILICNNTVLKIGKAEKILAIECVIDTAGKNPVSYTDQYKITMIK